MENLANQISEIDRQRREATTEVVEESLTAAERSFVERADRHGKRLLRNGWPDFLMIDPETGGMIAVEVKTPSDAVRPAQRRMFDALDKLGLRVVIWNPAKPDRLQPWRKHREPRERQHRRSGIGATGPRVASPRRPRPASTVWDPSLGEPGDLESAAGSKPVKKNRT